MCFVEVEDNVVGDDRVARREEGDEALHEVTLRRREPLVEVLDVVRKVDLVHRPRIAYPVLLHLVELGVAHRRSVRLYPGSRIMNRVPFHNRFIHMYKRKHSAIIRSTHSHRFRQKRTSLGHGHFCAARTRKKQPPLLVRLDGMLVE